MSVACLSVGRADRDGGKKMKKIVLALTLGILLVAGSVYAGGDLIVNGKLGIGTDTPNTKLNVVGTTGTNSTVSVIGTNNRRMAAFNNTLTDNTQPFGVTLNVTANQSGGVAGITGMNAVIALTHDSTISGVTGGSAASYIFQIGSATGSGTVDIDSVSGFTYTLNRRYNISSGLTYNVAKSYGALFKIQDGGAADSSGVVNVTNHYGSYIADYANSGTRRVDIANLTGLYIEKLIGGDVSNSGIVLAGDGVGADIVFGPNQEARIFSSSGELYTEDGLGNVTQISPHDPETGEWVYYSKNVKTGKVVRVNMEELVRDIEKLTGKKYMVETFEEIK